MLGGSRGIKMVINVERKANIVFLEEDIELMGGVLKFASEHIKEGDESILEGRIIADITNVKRFIQTLKSKLNLT